MLCVKLVSANTKHRTNNITFWAVQTETIFCGTQLFYVTRSKEFHWVVNNYSPKWRWTVVDIYRAAKRWGKYPPLSPTLRWIIVLVYTTQAEYIADQNITLFNYEFLTNRQSGRKLYNPARLALTKSNIHHFHRHWGE